MLNLAQTFRATGAKGKKVAVTIGARGSHPNASLARGMQTRSGERKISARKGKQTKAANATARESTRAAGHAAAKRLGERLRR